MEEQVFQFYEAIASDYDKLINKRFLSQIISQHFNLLLSTEFGRASRVLEVGCGTGKDAIYLSAMGVRIFGFDLSKEMIKIAKQKASLVEEGSRIEFTVGDAADLTWLKEKNFEGAYSNFNVVNHLSSIDGFAKTLAEKLNPGATVIITLLNRICLPEVLGYLVRFKIKTAVQKLFFRQDTFSPRLKLYFPKEFARLMGYNFSLQRTQGFGLLVPPVEFYGGKRFLRLFKFLAALERPFLKIYPFYNVCNMYILVLKRK